MKWLKLTIMFLLLIRAVSTDVKEGKIENRYMLAGMITGLLIAYGSGGVKAVWISAKVAGILLAAMFFLFVIKGLGAGDIKLFCTIAVFYPKQVLSVVILSFFTAAFLAIGKMIIRGINKKPFYIRKETLHFSIPIAVSTFVIIGIKEFL